MTSTPIEVDDWLSAKTFFHPRMTATIGLPVGDALARLAGSLASHGYRVKDATPAGFRATWWDKTWWLGLLAATDWGLNRTRLAVTATPAGTPTGTETLLTIQVEKGAEHRAGRRRGREALTEAFQDAQRLGVAVTTTPWVKP